MQIVAAKVTDSTTEMYMFCVHDEIDEMWAISEQWDIVKIAKWRSRGE